MVREIKSEVMQLEYDVDNKDDKYEFDRYVNDVTNEIEILGMRFIPSCVLEQDEDAYNEEFSNWADQQDERWECQECGEIHDSERKAENCCIRYACDVCGAEFTDEVLAEACCETPE